MNKIIGIISLLFLTISVNGQSNLSLQDVLGSKNYIMEATKDGFVLVQQEYVLRDENNELFGKDGNSYYGQNFYLGILINNMLYVRNDSKPWEVDINFPKEIDSLKPELSKIAYRIVNDTLSEFINIKNINKVENKNIYPLNSGSSFEIAEDVNFNDKLIFIYVTNNDKKLTQFSSFELRRANFNEIYNTKENCLIQNKMSLDMIGGAFFLPVISLGKIEYKLVASINKVADNWEISPVNTKQTIIKKKQGLTPIN
ncbi:hypothetical protein [Lutibacter sp.]|uniref:hypothetical protein n=1 Tax=Lutibacter sp. TaxID=1925666 RepID=UPI0035638E95